MKNSQWVCFPYKKRKFSLSGTLLVIAFSEEGVYSECLWVRQWEMICHYVYMVSAVVLETIKQNSLENIF